MSDCDCSSLPTVSCDPQSSPQPECGRIRMFFGYEPKINGKPGELNTLYYTDPQDNDSISKGFQIVGYSAQSLIDSRILKSLDPFILTEAELLASETWEGWLTFSADWKAQPTAGSNTSEPFGIRCMKSLGVDMGIFETDALKMFASLKNGDTSAFFSILYKSINMPIDDAKWGGYFEDPDQNDCKNLQRGLIIEKLKICWEWFKNIQETYYGKQFLVKVAGPKENDVFPGVCIKDEDGNSLPFNANAGESFYIEGDGSSQGYYTSDEIVDGGFPKENTNDILGLTKVDWVQNTDGKIRPFVKIGQISDGDSGPCPDMPKRKIYYKFTDHSGTCVPWIIDLSKLDINNYYIDKNDSYETLYMKCEIENRFYVDQNGTWVNITLAEKVPLTPQVINPIQGIVNWVFLLLGTHKADFYNFLNKFTDVSGSRGNSSQLNLALAKEPCLIPQGVVIPFKSNVYNYGPYYYVTDPDEGGGVEVIKENTIAPWNFIKPGEFKFPVSYPYCAMDKFGKELAKLSPKGLQKLEKGRANVVGLPCRGIGESLDSGYDSNKEIGPTLLTDISVDYGSSGFNTTYNFSTYSPRLGKSEKYLLDAWSHNIENTKYISSYLRNEKAKVEDIKKGYTKKLIDKNYYFNKQGGPKVKTKSTPNRLMFSGYYFSTTNNTEVPESSSYPEPETDFPPVASCDPSGSPDESIASPAIEYEASGVRSYTFSETDQAYSAQYIQNTYFQLAGMSLDGSYLPISLRGVNDDPKISEYNGTNNLTRNNSWQNAGKLPRFAMRCEFSEKFIEWETKVQDIDLNKNTEPGYPSLSKSRDEIPPFFMKIKDPNGDISTLNCYLLPIHQRYLNPFTTKNMLSGTGADDFAPWDGRKNSSTAGFVISSIVFGQKHTDYQISHTDISDATGVLTAEKTDEYIRQQYHNFRVPSLRGPLVLQGWGYDTSGKPIPNSADSKDNTHLGQFKKNQLTDRFLNNWLQDPKTWPVGPVDLRFDRERGVWTCASPNKIIAARLKEDLECGGSAKAELINPEAGGIRFYEKYNISGPNGEDVRLHMSKTEITVYDFLGEEIDACSKVYVYYDDNRYIVLRADKSNNKALRFRVIKLCKNKEDPSEHYESNTWGSFAGYGDKYYNYHIYGVRIDCNGNAVDKNGNKTEQEITEDFIKQNAANWLIKLQDNAGKFGPSYAHFTDYDTWKEKASTGYAIRGTNNSVSCVDASQSPSPSESAPPECVLGETSTACESPLNDEIENKLKVYDIIFLESYARFLHGCLTEDLYPKDSSLYSNIEYKKDHLYGNASVDSSGLMFYGDSPNGKEPIYLNSAYQELPIRVFDPWIKDNNGELTDIDCYTRQSSIFFNATSGTPFTAVFNEKDKKYYIWQINKKEDPIIRFKVIKLCGYITVLEDPSKKYDDDSEWGAYAGYGDKYHNYHTYGIRIDCDGIIVDKNGNHVPEANFPPTDQFLIDNATDWLIRLQDNAGKFGPSYGIFTDYETWNNRAATGYAALINDKLPTTSSSSQPEPVDCDLGSQEECKIINHDKLSLYDIIFVESYARFIHGCLTQDLYLTQDEASNSGDSYKQNYPSGNASAFITHYYGDSPNGKEPIYLNSDYQQLPIRVFDPWLDDNLNPIACYNIEDSHLFTASSGTPFTAIFNEKQKKYYISQIAKKEPSTIRFKLIDFCDASDSEILPAYGGDDSWTMYAGFGDKFPNKHILGVRINCNGEPVDIKGKILTQEDFFDEQGSLIINTDINKAKRIFINLLDTVGTHGPAYATYHIGNDNLTNDDNLNKWMELAATGFATICEIKAEGDCSLGENTEQCSNTKQEFKSYDILFIDTYARFIECELTQQLYVTEDEASSEYPNDKYKKDHPEGNASANIFDFYGDSPNGREPKFFKKQNEPTEFRVFDPFKDVAKNKNPFRNLKYGDKVLVIFNENLKKYIIWQSIKTHQDSIVKFALVTDKNYNDVTSTAVLVDEYGRPVDEDGVLLTEDNFAANYITVRDPFYSRSVLAPVPNDGTINGDLSAFGPALGSNIFQEHYDGIPLQNRTDSYVNIGPFIGFAMKRKISSDNSSTPPPTLDNEEYIYEIFQLEHYAKYVTGKICSKAAVFAGGYYLGSKRPNGYREGINPIARNTQDLPSGDLILAHGLLQFIGVHSYIIGSGGEYGYSDTDGCSFIALLDSKTSTCTNLIYNIIEAERVALAGQITLKTQSSADSLNNNDFTVSPDGTDMSSTWIQGFMWNQNNENFQDIKIFNRTDHVNRGLYIKNSAVGLILTGMDGDNNLVYGVTDGGTIARTVQRSVSNSEPGLFGTNLIPNIDRKINNTDGFMEGLDPSNLNINDKPIIALKNNKPWMTYYESIVTGAWDETIGGNVSACEYKIIYAREAPVIITGKVKYDLLPTNEDSEIILDSDPLYPSCPGVDKTPIPLLLENLRNPMGFGAKAGDYITVQRVFTNGAAPVAGGISNYYYLIINSGHPPGTLKE